MRFQETRSWCGARLEGWAATWFETPRTRLRNLSRSKVAAPHHEAGRRPRVHQISGIRFSNAMQVSNDKGIDQ